MLQLKCCGENGPVSWGNLQLTLRPSCCGGQSPCSVVQANQNGCKPAIEDFLVKHGKIVGGVAIGVAIVEVSLSIIAKMDM